MSTWAVIATGPSLNQEDVDYLRGRCNTMVVSDAYKLAPWADVLISHDRAWWAHNPTALGFEGQKFTKHDSISTVDPFWVQEAPAGCNSGLLGMFLARELGATRIILLGFDMQGTHFFGKHPDGLKNTSAERFKQHIQQFSRFRGAEVINCTQDSALTRYPFANLREVL
jgi:hypothetical protein